MPIRARCPQCAAAYNLADTLAGKKIRCQKCQGVISVPGAEIEDVTEAVAVPPAKQGDVTPSKPRRAAVRDEEIEPSLVRPTKAKSSKPIRSALARTILTLVIIGILLGISAVIVAFLSDRRGIRKESIVFLGELKIRAHKQLFLLGLGLLGLAGMVAVAAAVLTLFWLARAWRAVPEEFGGMSAGKAIGLLFVPLFSLYWMFRVMPGLSTALTGTLNSREPSRSFRAGYGAGLTACILSLIPCLNVFALVPFLMWLSSADRAVNRLVALQARRRSEDNDEDEPPRRRQLAEAEAEDERLRSKDKGKKAKTRQASSNWVLWLGVGGAILVLVGGVVAVLLIMNFQADPKQPGPQAAGKGDKRDNPEDKKAGAGDKEETPIGNVALTDEQLAKEYSAGASATLKKYGNAEVTVTGIVERLSKDGPTGKIVLVLRGHLDRKVPSGRVEFLFPVEDAARLKELVWGQSVKVRGKGPKGSIGGLRFTDGQLVEVGELPAVVATFTVEQMMDEYIADRAGMAQKYTDKVVEVSGLVALTGHEYGGGAYVHLRYKNPKKNIVSVRYHIKGRDEIRAYELSTDQAVTIRGRFSAAVPEWPSIEDGYLVEVGPDPALVMTAVELTKEVAADKEAAAKKYNGKPLRVEGVIAAIKKAEYGHSLELAGFDEGKAKPLRIVTSVSGGGSKQEAERLAALKVGQTIRLKGNGLISSTPDRISLTSAAVLRERARIN